MLNFIFPMFNVIFFTDTCNYMRKSKFMVLMVGELASIIREYFIDLVMYCLKQIT